MGTQIAIDKVSKIYSLENERINAVNDISVEFGKGDFVSISGHSGSGKTTLLSIIGGITKPTSGKIFFEGSDIYSFGSDKLSEYRCERIGLMFQFASLMPMLTAKENLLLPALFKTRTLRLNDYETEKKAEGLLNMVGLEDKINAYPSQLSGGQQRRVAIARSFMNAPDIILADEPTGDLDEETEKDMMKFFMRMNEEKELTFIIVTHSSELAGQTKRRLKMSNGVLTDI